MMRTKNSDSSSRLRKLFRYYGIRNTIMMIFYRYIGIIKSHFINIEKSRILAVNGYKLATMPNDKGISSELVIYGIHEPLTTAIINSEIKDGMTCLDIGSNIGYFAFLESQLVGPTGKVFAIEPSPLIFKMLQHNVGLQEHSNFELFNFACGNENGEVNFCTSNSSNLSRIENLEISHNDNTINVSKVEIKTIDSFLKNKDLNRLDFVRFDTEGFEFKIYQGMQETIKKYKPMLCFELHKEFLGLEKTLEFLKILQNDGYEIKYYVSGLNSAKFNDMKYVKKISVNELVDKIKNDMVPGGFEVFLTNNN